MYRSWAVRFVVNVDPNLGRFLDQHVLHTCMGDEWEYGVGPILGKIHQKTGRWAEDTVPLLKTISENFKIGAEQQFHNIIKSLHDSRLIKPSKPICTNFLFCLLSKT